MSRCLCPGSYDPVTNGHLDSLVRAAALYDEVVVGVLHNPAKQGRFPVEQRIDFLKQSLADDLPVRIEAYGGRLLVDIAQELDVHAIVKGLRGGTDFAYELPMALMNRHLTGVETVFLPGDPLFEHVSSSLVTEVATYGGDVTGLVPDVVRDALVARRQ